MPGGLSTVETSSISPFRGGDSRWTMLPFSRRIIDCIIRIPTLSEKLPTPLRVISVHGKITAASAIVIYIAFLAIWFPIFLFSYVVGEAGIYILSLLSVFFIGRCVIRLIAFPGASSNVVNDIEIVFSKYSVHMLTLSCDSLIDWATIIAQESPSGFGTSPRRPQGFNDLPLIRQRTKIFRDRVLGVYHEVLLHLYNKKETTHPSSIAVNSYGNNRLLSSDDVGNLSSLTPQAREDGKELLRLLGLVLQQLNELSRVTADPVLVESCPSPVAASNSLLIIDKGTMALQLVCSARELRDFCASLRRVPSSENGSTRSSVEFCGEEADPEDVTVDTLRRRLKESSITDTIKAVLSSILAMIDPPPHSSIFGLDVLRGTVLSRFRGARQVWIQRPHGGRLDVLYFPARRNVSITRNSRAVLYCNPNAGLIEVSTGIGLIGGNVALTDIDAHTASSEETEKSWTDYYTNQGLDVYSFNYAGYGRSHGSQLCGSCTDSERKGELSMTLLSRSIRIVKNAFFAFTPQPDTLRSDGIAVALHLIHNQGVEQLIVHGESIGGVAASAIGLFLSKNQSTRGSLSLLVCDRTFCNLEAVAQRLVGGWSGYAIRALAPFWGTDVAGDFVSANVPKVVANDARDAIIDDAASLKTGIALWKEIRRGIHRGTQDIAWVTEPPLQYRMAEWENVCVTDSKYAAGNRVQRLKIPVWPNDKRISLEEAIHFAACCSRIRKLAQTNRQTTTVFSLALSESSEGVECNGDGSVVHDPSNILISDVWKVIASCDGLVGTPLGVAVKLGCDSTVAWLCSTLVYGDQVIASRLAARASTTHLTSQEIIDDDFVPQLACFTDEESKEVIHPIALPEVVKSLTASLVTYEQLSHELTFVLGFFEYMYARLKAESLKMSRSKVWVDTDIGHFLHLTCGHNNAFSTSERQKLNMIIDSCLTRK